MAGSVQPVFHHCCLRRCCCCLGPTMSLRKSTVQPPLQVLTQPLSTVHMVLRPPTDLPPAVPPTPVCRRIRLKSTRLCCSTTHSERKHLLAAAVVLAAVGRQRISRMFPVPVPEVAVVLADRVVQSPADPSPVATDRAGKLRPASVPWFIWFVRA